MDFVLGGVFAACVNCAPVAPAIQQNNVYVAPQPAPIVQQQNYQQVNNYYQNNYYNQYNNYYNNFYTQNVFVRPEPVVVVEERPIRRPIPKLKCNGCDCFYTRYY